MICPKCGSKCVYVKDTMNSYDGKIYRRRLCETCGTRFRSVEIVDDGSEEFKKAYGEAAVNKSPLYRETHKLRREKHESR